jgi:carbamoyl-phosphate synthase small subunit
MHFDYSDDSPYFGPGVLALADGRVFKGMAFGARATRVGEIVFNTAMTGYQEILTDPSYAGQLVCLTVAEVGNVGVNPEDDESRGHGAEGLVVRSLSPVVSNWRARGSLHDFLRNRGMPGLGEVDTRALTLHVRRAGAIMAALSTELTDPARLVELARSAAPMEGRALAHEVSTREPLQWEQPSWGTVSPPAPDVHVVVLDYGVKLQILRRLRDEGARVTVLPSTASAREVLDARPDGVFLSNGPGDPAALHDIVATVRELLKGGPQVPLYGICLGHQLLCLALGGRTYKLKFGHHGGNHPVRAEAERRVAITAQNHGFAADAASLADHGATVTHVNLFDATVAGLELRDRPVRAVQFHPEASPGPHDAAAFFGEFVARVRAHKQSHASPA